MMMKFLPLDGKQCIFLANDQHSAFVTTGPVYVYEPSKYYCKTLKELGQSKTFALAMRERGAK